MPRRRSPRYAAWIALVAILLSLLPPAGAYSLGAAASFGTDSDYCSTVGVGGATPALPSPTDHGRSLCSHCDGCSGSAGNGVALAAPVARAVARRSLSTALLPFDAPLPAPADLIAAPPRGPPHSA